MKKLLLTIFIILLTFGLFIYYQYLESTTYVNPPEWCYLDEEFSDRISNSFYFGAYYNTNKEYKVLEKYFIEKGFYIDPSEEDKYIIRLYKKTEHWPFTKYYDVDIVFKPSENTIIKSGVMCIINPLMTIE